MQSKEEILAINCGHSKLTEGDKIRLPWALNAMQEFANQQSIDFGRELLKHADITMDGEGMFEWALYEGNVPIKYSTEEMYNKLMIDKV